MLGLIKNTIMYFKSIYAKDHTFKQTGHLFQCINYAGRITLIVMMPTITFLCSDTFKGILHFI